MSEVWVVATLTFKPSKRALFEESIVKLAKMVEDNEPNTQCYRVLRELDAEVPRAVIIEKYKTRADFEEHTRTEYYKEAIAAMGQEDVLAEEVQILVLEGQFGFESR